MTTIWQFIWELTCFLLLYGLATVAIVGIITVIGLILGGRREMEGY